MRLVGGIFLAVIFVFSGFGGYAQAGETMHVAAAGDGPSFTVSPNPVAGNAFTVSFQFGAKQFPSAELTITNVLGQKVFTYGFTAADYLNRSVRIDLGETRLDKGVYFVKISSGEHSSLQKIAVR